MKQLELGQVKEIQLQILDAVADFCDAHNIRYWLDYGTLLGAVRHKGYIPWDDDIDIGMLREDYDRFYELFNKNGERYRLFCPMHDEDYQGVCAKVCDMNTVLYEPDESGIRLHLNIDIFIYDAAPCKEHRVRQLYHRASRYLLFHMLRHGLIADRGQMIRRVLLRTARVFLKIFPPKFFLMKLMCNGCNENDIDPEKVGMFGWGYYLLLDRKVVTDVMEQQFENRTYHAPRNYDAVLTQQYGDYMTLPPVEKRVSHHDFVAYMR